MDTTYTRPTDKMIILRTILIILMDILAAVACFFCGLWLRFDFSIGQIQPDFMAGFAKNMAVWCTIEIIVFAIFRLYSSVWVYVGTSEVFRIIGAYAVLAVIGVVGGRFYGVILPRSSCIIGFVFNFLCTLGIRFSYRILKTLQISASQMTHATGIPNVMVIGAGDAGRAVAEEYLSSETIGEHLSCFIDDNPALMGKRLCGVPIAGNRKNIGEAVKKYRIDKIIFAIPSATASTRRNILKLCCETGCKVLVMPDSNHIEAGDVRLRKLRKVDPQDMLGREPARIDKDQIESMLSGKSILVIGAAGAVGSELCRQIAKFAPAKLTAFDLCETDSYELQTELQHNYPELSLKMFIGSAQNPVSLKNAFTACHPQIVFYAAGHMYINLMENSPNEAVLNNVFGPYHAAKAADQFGTEQFILVSGERAKDPQHMVGACHYLSEKIVKMMNSRSETRYDIVRFGNLLGSSSSVIPLFRKQIEEGGPVTVTHPEVSRYFMTVNEAVKLLLQACAYGKGGETFSLDMGEPVKIDTMARNLILLSGHKPDEDIKIQYIGLRPGEKLHEDAAVHGENTEKTANPRIYREPGVPLESAAFETELMSLQNACSESADYVRKQVAAMVPGYGAAPAEQKV